jgi:hypothetical protein
MNAERLIGLMGYSVNHPDFEKLFTELKVAKPFAKEVKHGLQIDDLHLRDIGLWLQFTTAIGYPIFHGKEPLNIFTNDKYELILNDISFFDKTGNYCSYPFDLKFGDSYEATVRKIGIRPIQKSKAHPTGFVLCFFTEEFRILVYTDDDKNLESVWVRVIESTDKKRIELKKRIKDQTKLITTENVDKVRQLTDELPTESWKIRMSEGDTSFTKKNIELSETVLNEFIGLVLDAVAAKKVNKIIAAVKKTTLAFNKLNDKNENFIETMEREELVAFMQRAVELTGFQVDGVDITEEWREW